MLVPGFGFGWILSAAFPIEGFIATRAPPAPMMVMNRLRLKDFRFISVRIKRKIADQM
jgi:hypothetical protein